MTKELPVLEAKERNDTLTQLAGEITDLYLSAEHKAKRAFETAGDAVNDALLCGKKLNEAKARLKHGEWLPWLRENCPEISEDKSERYRALANSAHDRNLEACASLRQAYIACGILPQPVATVRSNEPIDFKDLLRFAGFAAKLTVENFNAVPLADDQKEQLRDRLKPAHDAYLALL